MSKKALVQTITQDGKLFGQVSNPQDLIKAQDFLHNRIGDLTADFLNNSKANEIIGFNYQLGVGNAFNITIKTPGRIYAKSGLSYELLADATVAIQASDLTNPRLDLVVAVLEDEVDADFASIPFVRLRTSDEFSNAVPPYPPQNINAPREKHFRAVIEIKTGTPAMTPTPPGVASNEVPLYLLNVAAKVTQISDADVTDLREVISTLRQTNKLTGENTIDIANLNRRVGEVEIIANMPVDLTQVFGQIRTLGDILALYQRQINALRDLPEIRYDLPKYPLTDPNSSKIMAVSSIVSGTKVIDIDVGGLINFGDVEVMLRPEKFADASLNARFAHPPIATVRNETDLILNNVTQLAADGFTDFVERASAFITPRARPGVAARNSQFVEIFGGLALNNASALGDWLTYDVENDTLTPRISPIPVEADRPTLVSCGDGLNVLLIAANTGNQSPRIFKLNAANGTSVEITSTKPTGTQFIADLIAPNKIFIVAVKTTVSGPLTEFWEFDTITNVFTELGVTGSIPVCEIDYTHGCLYEDNQFVLVKFTPGVSSSGETYIFDRASLTWTEFNIAQPYGQTAEKQLPLAHFNMANVNGRPLLVGGLLTKETDTDNSRVWELTRISATPFSPERLKWQSFDGTFPPVQSVGFCSTLVNSKPRGKAFLFAGHNSFRGAKNLIFGSVQGGLIATTYNGQPAIGIAETSTYATFVLPVYTAPWDIQGYLTSFKGIFDSANLKVEVSFNGTDYQQVFPDRSRQTDTFMSDTRQIRITLYNLKSSKPILSHLTEVFDEDGADILESRLVIRYDAPATTKALYIDRNGVITSSSAIAQSTPDKCLLHKSTPDGVNPPKIKNYVNRRRPHVKYSKTKDATAASTQFENELAVPVRYIDARAVLNTNAIYKIPDPVINFDATVNVSNVANNGDIWIVELEG